MQNSSTFLIELNLEIKHIEGKQYKINHLHLRKQPKLREVATFLGSHAFEWLLSCNKKGPKPCYFSPDDIKYKVSINHCIVIEKMYDQKSSIYYFCHRLL